MGRNGAGKSTVLDLIAGMRRPSRGTVMLDGRPLDAWTPTERARRVGHLPQAVRAELPFTVEQLVLMGRYPACRPVVRIRRRSPCRRTRDDDVRTA